MDEQDQTNPPQKYLWPRFVLAGVVLGIVLAIVWMAVLVRRIREQREDLRWPTNATKAISPQTNQSPTAPAASPNTTLAH